MKLTNVCTGSHNAAAGLKLGDFGKFIINQPSVGRPVKLVLCLKKYLEPISKNGFWFKINAAVNINPV